MKKFTIKCDSEIKFTEPKLNWIDEILGRRKSSYEKMLDHMADQIRQSVDQDILDTIIKDASK